MVTFDEHGDYNVYWEDDALFVKPSGAFNEAGAISLNNLIVETVESHDVKNWYRFEVFQTEDTMGTPEAESHLAKSFMHSRQHGCKMVLLVGANICEKETLTKACHLVGLDIEIFEKLGEAKEFVNTLRSKFQN
jgi:hypothetical protein